MSRVCELTGKKAMVGNNVSHAMNKTRRTFDANLIKLYISANLKLSIKLVSKQC